MQERAKSLDPQLWLACAGGMVHMPPLNSLVYYFPQGHAEHASSPVVFPRPSTIPPLVLSRVVSVDFLADPDTDEVFATVGLVPCPLDIEDDSAAGAFFPGKPASFVKVLTQSDANSGGAFSIPRCCAETIFPKLDYSVDPPVRTVVAVDVHGTSWKFRHIYRGTPKRHLLTTGWGAFVSQKKLAAGDSIVFSRSGNGGDLYVGIRRAKRQMGDRPEFFCAGWSSRSGSSNCLAPLDGRFCSPPLREDKSKFMRAKDRLRPETVVEAANLAASGLPFEVVYYPRAGTPEFCVRAASVKAGMKHRWCPGMRLQMPLETENSSRMNWFMGTVSSIQVADPICWPMSPWRLLQVTWDEPNLLHNTKHVSPWLVEFVPDVRIMHVSSIFPPRKKLRLPDYPELALEGHVLNQSFAGNRHRPGDPLCCSFDNGTAGVQEARLAQFGNISPSDHLKHQYLRLGWLSSPNLQHFDPRHCYPRSPDGIAAKDDTSRGDSSSCSLNMGISSQKLPEKEMCNERKPRFVLFGKPILTEQQIVSLRSGDTESEFEGKSRSDWTPGSPRTTELIPNNGHCKVFLQSEDVGRSLDLTILSSYDELYRKLTDMFGIVRSETLSHVLYEDSLGGIKHAGIEPFGNFAKTAKRLTIFICISSGSLRRSLLVGANTRFEPAKAARGPLSTFA